MSKRVSIRGQFSPVDTAPAFAFMGGTASKSSNTLATPVPTPSSKVAPKPSPNFYRIYNIISKLCENNQPITTTALATALVEVRQEMLSQNIQSRLETRLTEIASATNDSLRNWHISGLFSYLQGIIDCRKALLDPIEAETETP